MEFHHLIILFFAFQGTLMGILFILRESDVKYANILLATFLFSSSWLFLSSVLFWSNLLYEPKFIHFDLSFYIPFTIFGPSFFFYIRNICTGQKIKFKNDYFHFIPLLYILFSIGPYYILSNNQKQIIYRKGTIGEFTPLLFTHIDAIIVLLLVFYASILIFKYWNHDKVSFDLMIWRRAILIAFSGSVLTFFTYYLLFYIGALGTGEDYVIMLVLSIFILVISYFAFNYSEVFNGKRIDKVIPFVKYKKTGLSKNISLELKEKLVALMEEKKPFLDVEIRLDDLSELLGVSRHQTSQVINEHFETGFFDFINSYRIDESKRILKEQKTKINLSEVAYLSGFNNTVSFNLAFKKLTGITPSEFRKLIIEGLPSD